MQGLPTKSLSPAAHGSKMIQGEATGKAKAQALGDIAVDGNGEEARQPEPGRMQVVLALAEQFAQRR